MLLHTVLIMGFSKFRVNQPKQMELLVQVRAEFIDPLLEVLGWDARNVHGRGE